MIIRSQLQEAKVLNHSHLIYVASFFPRYIRTWICRRIVRNKINPRIAQMYVCTMRALCSWLAAKLYIVR